MLNQQIFKIHRITGLIAGVFLLLLSFTGSLLVFSDEIDHAVNKGLYEVKPGGDRLPLNELYQKGAAANPGSPYLTFLRLPQAPNESLIMRAEYSAEDKVYNYLDPYTGEVIYRRGNKNYFTGWLLFLHFTLLSGRNGSIIILCATVLMLISIATGLYVYRKHLGKVLTFRDKIEWKYRQRRWRNLHRVVGVWALLFNLLMVITGITIQLRVVSSRVAKTTAYEIPQEPIDYDHLLTVARAEIPGITIMGIRPPKTAGGPVLFLGNAGEPALFGEYSSTVSVQPEDGKVVKKIDFKTAGFSQKLNASVIPLHFGNYGGIPLKILWTLLGLTPGALALSGILIWYRRKFIVKKRMAKR
ncbi:PepSY-associated TM helix domain-containing protein [Chitinophaga sp. GCM10012297]|uniref:PepSY domain-containing protein n=1 Tax=Chitinophaga chungangae TaxID=2821488 RepID=A0ABS3Y8E7_9BACT|nr:PepSY-associated TM helix domain-containing protein [Chitinophaga chungangae]MBO9150931.1 PepSY domain-containing protein [Chitinophaga chungangae]